MVRGQQTTEETLLVTLLLREWDRISEFMCCFFREPCWVCYSGTLTRKNTGLHKRCYYMFSVITVFVFLQSSSVSLLQ